MAEAAGRKSLLQISLVYINTLMIQRVLGEPNWTQRMTPEDLRALTPLTYTHVTPYGMFRFDMNKRLDIDASGLLPDVRPGRTLPLVTRMFLQGLPGSAGALLSVLLAGPAVIVAQSPLNRGLGSANSGGPKSPNSAIYVGEPASSTALARSGRSFGTRRLDGGQEGRQTEKTATSPWP